MDGAEPEAVLDARRMGLPEETIDELRRALAASEPSPCGLWPENVEIVEAFLSVASQWRTAPIGGGMAPVGVIYIGLDYTAVRAGLEASGRTITPELWEGIRMMEVAAREALNGVRG